MTNEVLDKISQNILDAVPGIATDSMTYVHLEYIPGRNEVYGKFMSDGGQHDDPNGVAFRTYLNELGIPLKDTPSGQIRSFLVNARDLDLLFNR